MCNNGCGQEIVWNNDLHFFVETNSGERHRCPNYRPQQGGQASTSTTAPRQQQQQTDQLSVVIQLSKFLQERAAKDEERTRTTQEYLMGISWMLQKLLRHFNLETAPPDLQEED